MTAVPLTSPCPFCNSADTFAHVGYNNIVFVQCGGCRAITSFGGDLNPNQRLYTLSEAIALYNRRADK